VIARFVLPAPVEGRSKQHLLAIGIRNTLGVAFSNRAHGAGGPATGAAGPHSIVD